MALFPVFPYFFLPLQRTQFTVLKTPKTLRSQKRRTCVQSALKYLLQTNQHEFCSKDV